MALPSSGAISIQMINAEFGRGYDLAAYRGTQWWDAAGNAGLFSTGTISMAEFYGKQAQTPDSRPYSGSVRTQSDWGLNEWYTTDPVSLHGGDANPVQVRWNGSPSGTRQVRFQRTAGNLTRVTWEDFDLVFNEMDGAYYVWRSNGSIAAAVAKALVTLYV